MQKVFPIDIKDAVFHKLEVIQMEMGDQNENMAVQIVDPEFSSVCPRTGMPDFGTVVLQYIPLNKRVELKVWKLYLRDFYGVGMFHEACTQKIMDEFVRIVEPSWVRLTIIWGARGGLHTTTQMIQADQDFDSKPDMCYWSDPFRHFKDPAKVAAEWRNR